jgi:hypothetical protein
MVGFAGRDAEEGVIADGIVSVKDFLHTSGFRPGCLCCGRQVRLQCETVYCGSRCRQGKCGHRG